jgi:4-amino-4-deoxy-L-arabinose transferase-like glycosyltransferase
MTAGRSGRLPWLLAAALALRLALAAGAWVHAERLLTEEDSSEYVQLARNLAAGHGFSQAVQPPFAADVRRTPVYPSFLAALLAVPGSGARCAALVGALISVLTVAATFRLVDAVMGPAAAWRAALLLAFDLTSAAYATQLLTEPLFTLLLVLSFLPLLDATGPPSGAGLVAGVLSGLAALCRPIGILVFAALTPACFVHRRDGGRRLGVLATMTVVAIAMTGAWTFRNYRAAGTATVSSVAATNMYFHRAAYVQAWLDGRRVEDLRADWQRDFDARAGTWTEEERVLWMNAHGRNLVLNHPVVYAIVALRGVARMLTPDHIVLASLTGGATTALFRVVHAIGWVQLAIVYGLVAMALARVRAVGVPRLLVPLAPIAYFVLIGGPEMYPRFRVPIMPFVCALAAAGLGTADQVRER